jgi:lysozyme
MTTEVYPQDAGFIVSWEAMYQFAYQDIVKVWTIGGGHTAAAGGIKPVRGMTLTLQQCCALLLADLVPVYTTVDKAIKVKVPQVVRGMLGSLEFNTGSLVKGSVDDKINAGNMEAAYATWLQYNKAGGKVVRGLQNRRNAEVKACRANAYPSSTVTVYDKPGSKGRVVQISSLPWSIPAPKVSTITVPPLPDKAPPNNFVIDLWLMFWKWIRK